MKQLNLFLTKLENNLEKIIAVVLILAGLLLFLICIALIIELTNLN